MMSKNGKFQFGSKEDLINDVICEMKNIDKADSKALGEYHIMKDQFQKLNVTIDEEIIHHHISFSFMFTLINRGKNKSGVQNHNVGKYSLHFVNFSDHSKISAFCGVIITSKFESEKLFRRLNNAKNSSKWGREVTKFIDGKHLMKLSIGEYYELFKPNYEKGTNNGLKPIYEGIIFNPNDGDLFTMFETAA